ncbi:MAG: NHL repeat-containing protein [Bacteroidota bacterium]
MIQRCFTLLMCLVLLVVYALPVSAQSTTMFSKQAEVDIYGNFYVLNAVRNTLRLLSRDRGLKREIGGSGWENDQFDRPAGMWARNGIDVFVADYGNHRIQRFDRSLNYISTLYTRENPNPDERFGYPTDVALSRLGDLFICDKENSRIVKVNRFSQVERTLGGFDAGKGRLSAPTQVEIGPKDHVYVVDGTRVVVYDTFGNFLRELAAFRSPLLLHADESGVVVADSAMLYCFDDEERPVCTLGLQEAAGVRSEAIRSLAFSRDSMFVLGAEGVTAIVSPRRKGQEQ